MHRFTLLYFFVTPLTYLFLTSQRLFILFDLSVDASQAGEGQLEISINEGQVPNHVQVVGGGRCLISFTPETPKPHYINIKFNGETVIGTFSIFLYEESLRN